MNTEKYKKLMLLVIPLIVFIFALFMKHATGPYWLGSNLDPSYIYLNDSLRIAVGRVPTIVEHPGTTLQIFGAAVIRILNLGSVFQNDEIIRQVLNSPEYYLTAIFNFLLISHIFSLILLGMYSFRKTKSLLFSLLIQSASLFYITLKSYLSNSAVLPVIANVHPESLMITVNNLYVLCALKLYFDKSNKDYYFSSILFGLVCGMGIITKITFAPLVLFPIILLPKLKAKGLFLLSFIVSMFGFFSPGISRLAKTFEWLTSLTTHTGIYGTGKTGFIDFSQIINNLKLLIHWNLFLFACILISSIFILYRFINRKIFREDNKNIRSQIYFF